jgi:hypothetical protein
VRRKVGLQHQIVSDKPTRHAMQHHGLLHSVYPARTNHIDAVTPDDLWRHQQHDFMYQAMS